MHLNSGFDSAQTVVSMYDIIYFCVRSIIYRISVVNCLLVARLRLAFACRLPCVRKNERLPNPEYDGWMD